MAIIYQKDNRSGITYAYEAVYRWDKEKKQSRSVRTLIGRLNEETGEIVPTDGRNRKKKENIENGTSKKRGPKPSPVVKHQYYGATYLLDCISEELGLTTDLRACFPNTYKQILSIAYYLILEDKSPLYRFEKWNFTHVHPHGDDIPSPRSSELFCSLRLLMMKSLTSPVCKANGESKGNIWLMIVQVYPAIPNAYVKFCTDITKKMIACHN